MASINKRKQMVNQLRKAHFYLGFQQNNQPISQYNHKYPEYQIVTQNSKKQNPREHHYELGNQSQKNYQSQFKHSFPVYKNQQKSNLSTEMINDLRNQHFQFGYHDNAKQSQYNDNFYKKPIPPQNYQQKKQNAVQKKKHNHEFGDSLTYFSTTYNEKHNKNMHDNVNTQSKPVIDGNLLRKTNLILGNQQLKYDTQNSSTFTNKGNQGYKLMKYNDNNIQLGKDQNQYLSSNKNDFTHKQYQATKVDKNKIRDFKSAHFTMGSPNPLNQYQSEHQAQFNQKQLKIIQQAPKPVTNVQISMDHQNTLQSNYKQNFLGVSAQRRAPCKLAGQLNSVTLGSDAKNFISEGKAAYIKHPIVNHALDNQRKNQLQGVSINLGNHQSDFSTQHRQTYADRFLQNRKAGMSEQQIQQLKKKHFDHGYQDVDYIKSSEKYGQRFGPANKLDQKVQKGMRITNMVDNDGNVKVGTTYNSSFHWKINNDL